jgi:hypothetical protein
MGCGALGCGSSDEPNPNDSETTSVGQDYRDSERAIQEEWNQFVQENNACTTVDDCVLVMANCPIGCEFGITASKEDEAIAKAQSLILRYQTPGMSCSYSCVPAEVDCIDQQCVAVRE